MNYYERHLGDYAKKAGHLSMLEHGAYTILLDVYYIRESPLPGETSAIFRLVRAQTEAEREAVCTVLSEFFHLQDGAYHHSRCDAEIVKYQSKSGKARASANARWGAQRSQCEGNAFQDGSHTNGNAIAMPSLCERIANELPTQCEGNAHQTPDTRHQKKNPLTPRKRGEESDPVFERVWAAYPRRDAKAAALKAWRKLSPEPALVDEIVSAIAKQAASHDWRKDGGQFIPMLATYLNGKRWQDAGVSAPATNGSAMPEWEREVLRQAGMSH